MNERLKVETTGNNEIKTLTSATCLAAVYRRLQWRLLTPTPKGLYHTPRLQLPLNDLIISQG